MSSLLNDATAPPIVHAAAPVVHYYIFFRSRYLVIALVQRNSAIFGKTKNPTGKSNEVVTGGLKFIPWPR